MSHASLTVHADRPGDVISRHVYGHFAEHLGACIYGGFWVGPDSKIPNTRGIRNDVVQALKQIRIPNLRWPGGCFADGYHWRDGIGPRETRPRRVNAHWGKIVEDGSFGTHEFMDLCGQLGCDAYLAGNVGSGTPAEMRDWIEYLTFPGDSTLANERKTNGRDEPWKIAFWGVGNENWGCGGDMRPEYYADLYKRYQCFCRRFEGNEGMKKIACGAGNMDGNASDAAWNEVLLKNAARFMDGLSIHHYTSMRSAGRASATQFGESEWHESLCKAIDMETFIEQTVARMDRHDPRNKIMLVVDEWGTWFDVEPDTNPGFLYQQSTVRDALVAGLTLNAFHRHCRRVRLANLAQTVNVLQAPVLTRDDQMVLTPTYHVLDLYQVHQDATMLPCSVDGGVCAVAGEMTKGYTPTRPVPALDASASRDAAGAVHVSLCNPNPSEPLEVSLKLRGGKVGTPSGRIVTSANMTDFNDFGTDPAVSAQPFDGAKPDGDALRIELPPMSVVTMKV